MLERKCYPGLNQADLSIQKVENSPIQKVVFKLVRVYQLDDRLEQRFYSIVLWAILSS